MIWECLHSGGSSNSGSSHTERSLAALAEELFEDAHIREEYSQGMTWSLQRTCDGATQGSRILELSGL